MNSETNSVNRICRIIDKHLKSFLENFDNSNIAIREAAIEIHKYNEMKNQRKEKSMNPKYYSTRYSEAPRSLRRSPKDLSRELSEGKNLTIEEKKSAIAYNNSHRK